MQVLTLKIIVMVLLGGISLVVGLIPMCFTKCLKKSKGKQNKKAEISISCLACFGGGVILTTCFLHMLPDVNLYLRHNIESGLFPDTGLAIAEILALSGFFMIYIVEEITHICIHKFYKPKENASKSEITPMMLHGGDGHGHSHSHHKQQQEYAAADLGLETAESEEDGKASFEAALRGFMLILALSLHEVFEGIALGLTHNESAVWFLFFAIASHKYLISFCIGMQFVSSGVRPCLTIVYIATFSLITVVGAGIGAAISATSQQSESSMQGNLVVVLNGIATGTLLYVVFFEIFEKERSKGSNGILQVTFILLGFVCMVLLKILETKNVVVDSEALDDLANSTGQSCQILNFDLTWRLPMNMTCVDGVLTPSEIVTPLDY